MEALRKTRKEMLKRATKRRYVVVWRPVAVKGDLMKAIVNTGSGVDRLMVESHRKDGWVNSKGGFTASYPARFMAVPAAFATGPLRP